MKFVNAALLLPYYLKLISHTNIRIQWQRYKSMPLLQIEQRLFTSQTVLDYPDSRTDRRIKTYTRIMYNDERRLPYLVETMTITAVGVRAAV